MDFDLTSILLSLVGGIGSVIASVAVYLINQRVKDAALRVVLSNAVKNSIGYAEGLARNQIESMKPTVHVEGVPAELQSQVQYVFDHAREAVERFNIPPGRIAQKVVSEMGLTKT